jgi:P pilus assembly chaperone PapD
MRRVSPSGRSRPPMSWPVPLSASLCPALLAALLSASPARAALSLSPLILDISPDQAARGDVELFNSGTERLYVVVAPTEVQDPGKSAEHRVESPDPEQLGILATPNRIILEPGERKFLRIALLKPPGPQDRVYRITVKPVVGGLAGEATGLKLIVGYEMLVIQRPTAPQAQLAGHREGDAIVISNAGNSNAELFQGKQCPAASPGANCTPLDSHRIYAGASVSIPVKPGFKAEYTVKVRDKVSTTAFD